MKKPIELLQKIIISLFAITLLPFFPSQAFAEVHDCEVVDATPFLIPTGVSTNVTWTVFFPDTFSQEVYTSGNWVMNFDRGFLEQADPQFNMEPLDAPILGGNNYQFTYLVRRDSDDDLGHNASFDFGVNFGENGYHCQLTTFNPIAFSTSTPIVNAPPTINPISNVTINENDIYSESGFFTDHDASTSWTAIVNYGDGSGVQPLILNIKKFSLSHQYATVGTYTVTVTITDNQGLSGQASAIVTVSPSNNTPSIAGITTSVASTQVNTSVTASANFTDQDTADTHTAVWDWGDGTTSNGTVNESNGTGSVSDSHTYTTTGVYEITLTVTDNNDASTTSTYQYHAVYDASAGWASGSKEFTSPLGAVVGNASATGKANFGFQVKYHQGDMIPSGKNIEFSFPDGNIEFASTSYLWLVVNGTKAVLKANGTLNGVSGYTMLISAIDQGSQNGLVRFQIKDSSNNVVYDTQSGASDTSDPITPVSKGKIKVN